MCSPRTRGAESGRASASRPLLTRPSPDVRGGAERDIAAAGDGADLVEEVASGMSRAPLALARPVSLVAVVSPLQRLHRSAEYAAEVPSSGWRLHCTLPAHGCQHADRRPYPR